MPVKLIAPTASAYVYPLLIKHLLHQPLTRAPEQEIVYRDLRRRTYREFRERIGRLASGLAHIGVEEGDTVAIMEWDSDRYHECYFAIPMMGAVMQTINVSLTPDDIAYTINDTRAKAILFNLDFVPLLQAIAPKLETAKTFVVMHDRPSLPPIDLPVKAEYEALIESGSAYYQFPDFDENAIATIFHTTGTTGRPKGVYFSHRQIVLHTLCGLVEYGLTPEQGRYHRADVYMPLTPMFHVHAWGCPYTATLAGSKLVFPGRYAPDVLLKLIQTEKVTFTHCVPTILQMLLDGAVLCSQRPSRAENGGRRIVAAAGAHARGDGARHRRICRLRTIGGRPHADHLPSQTPAFAAGTQRSVIASWRASAAPLVELRVVSEDMIDAPHDGGPPAKSSRARRG